MPTLQFTPSSRELPFWLALCRVPGVGPIQFGKLLAKYPRLSALFEESPESLKSLGLSEAVISAIKKPDWGDVEEDLHWQGEEQCHILTFQDELYPALLKQIPAAPPVIYVKGNLKILNSPQIGIVGSRNPTPVGLETAYHFGWSLCKAGLLVTSGLALGIDGASHRGALAATGQTIAVMGRGLSQIYPMRHHLLAQQILNSGGTWVSEYPPKTPVRPEFFPRRNRLISGLSMGILVVEASLKSGSLITARYALEQNRDIFAIPGAVQNPNAKGCHWLIRQGAKLVEKVSDILEELPGTYIDPESVPESSATLDPTLRSLLECVDFSATPLDVIMSRTQMSYRTVSSLLVELELKGLVISQTGGYIRGTLNA